VQGAFEVAAAGAGPQQVQLLRLSGLELGKAGARVAAGVSDLHQIGAFGPYNVNRHLLVSLCVQRCKAAGVPGACSGERRSWTVVSPA
jgi:hypothetical protein